MLVSDTAAPGLQPSEPPSLDDIPNNHFAYAIQWFIFAMLAVGIYAIALWRRKPTHTSPPRSS
jgi:cytochrome oxidase assembly protein ShyY1